jgi:2-dehydro-3-deoxyphosphogalactonate aldolase
MQMSRRQFLRTTALTAASANVAVHTLAQEVEQSGRSLQITGIESIAVKVPEELESGSVWLFVKILTNKRGLVGYGEVYTLGIPFHPATLSAMVKDFGGELAIGANPYHIESLFQKGYGFGYSHYPEFTRMGILSAIETACWDIVGKDLNKPVYELLGGSVRNRIRTYTYIKSRDPKQASSALWHDSQGSAQRAKEYLDEGFTALKLDPVLGSSSSRAIRD